MLSAYPQHNQERREVLVKYIEVVKLRLILSIPAGMCSEGFWTRIFVAQDSFQNFIYNVEKQFLETCR